MVQLRLAGLFVLLAAPLIGAAKNAGPDMPRTTTPIQHVVIIFQENHSFNDLLGALCIAEGNRCDATNVGEISDGTQVALKPEPDVPPETGHAYHDQVAAINGGLMNGWDNVDDCGATKSYRCLEQAQAGAVPDLWAMADSYAISDRTFEGSTSSSWGSHLELVAQTTDGFLGEGPVGPHRHGYPQVGCNTTSDALWTPPEGGSAIMVPACVPDINGNGPYRPSPVQYVPTIMDSFDNAGLSWNIFAPGLHGGGYAWSICPTFNECLTTQDQHVVPPQKFARYASKGQLPNLSILIPVYNNSQHNGHSLIKGDNWIAQNVAAIMNGPDWASTAIFITYDDCGCYYDPVLPPAGDGIRVPMVIVSPYARPHFVDHNDAVYASMSAFMEHNWGLLPLAQEDANAYDYSGAFDFSQAPLPPIRLVQHPVPASSIREMLLHPANDEDDPT